jgi:hypothetical protein
MIVLYTKPTLELPKSFLTLGNAIILFLFCGCPASNTAVTCLFNFLGSSPESTLPVQPQDPPTLVDVVDVAVGQSLPLQVAEVLTLSLTDLCSIPDTECTFV